MEHKKIVLSYNEWRNLIANEALCSNPNCKIKYQCRRYIDNYSFENFPRGKIVKDLNITKYVRREEDCEMFEKRL